MPRPGRLTARRAVAAVADVLVSVAVATERPVILLTDDGVAYRVAREP